MDLTLEQAQNRLHELGVPRLPDVEQAQNRIHELGFPHLARCVPKLPNDIIMKIILESTTTSNLEYHSQRMECNQKDHKKNYNEVIGEIRDLRCDIYPNQEITLSGGGMSWDVYWTTDTSGTPDQPPHPQWIEEFTEDSANLVGCPPTLNLVLEIMDKYDAKLFKIYPKLRSYLKNWDYWGENFHDN